MIRFEIYEVPGFVPFASRWYWRAKAANRRTVADGSQSYFKKGNAQRAVNRFIELLGATDFEIVVLGE